MSSEAVSGARKTAARVAAAPMEAKDERSAALKCGRYVARSAAPSWKGRGGREGGRGQPGEAPAPRQRRAKIVRGDAAGPRGRPAAALRWRRQAQMRRRRGRRRRAPPRGRGMARRCRRPGLSLGRWQWRPALQRAALAPQRPQRARRRPAEGCSDRPGWRRGWSSQRRAPVGGRDGGCAGRFGTGGAALAGGVGVMAQAGAHPAAFVAAKARASGKARPSAPQKKPPAAGRSHSGMGASSPGAVLLPPPANTPATNLEPRARVRATNPDAAPSPTHSIR
eukprot:scaffold16237_cov112-Isochrysis_galbana.AAC.6